MQESCIWPKWRLGNCPAHPVPFPLFTWQKLESRRDASPGRRRFFPIRFFTNMASPSESSDEIIVWQFGFTLTYSLENRAGNCLWAGHVSPPTSCQLNLKEGKCFTYLLLSHHFVISQAGLSLIPPILLLSRGVNLLQDYKSMKKGNMDF